MTEFLLILITLLLIRIFDLLRDIRKSLTENLNAKHKEATKP